MIPRGTRRLARILFVVAGLLAIAGPSRAASPELERAIAIGRDGIRLYEARSYAQAFERFAVADRMAHSVVFVLYMARCKRNLGELVAAKDLLGRVISDALPADSSEPMRRAQGEARQELETLKGRIPSIVVNVTGSAASSARVAIDRKPVDATGPVELDPGEHTVEATSPSADPALRTVRLTEGSGPVVVALHLGRGSASAAPGAREPRGSLVPAFIAFGTSAASAGVGTVTGLLAMDQASSITARCVEKHCLPSDKQKGASAGTLATVSTVAFIGAGVAAAAGVVLVIVRPGGSSAGKPETQSASKAGSWFTLSAGPGSLELRSGF